jgi:predicted HAD superfamily hydrolase
MQTNSSNIFETKFDNNAVISFDLFDTLVEEPFSHHSDLFDLMNSEVDRIVGKQNFNFKKIRLLSEKLALKNTSKEVIDLNDIYFEFQKITNLNQNYIMEIEKLEICFEQKFYQVKPIGQQLFLFAQSLNKKIVIIADSYLPRFFIEGLLDRLGYYSYNDLFVSSELGLSKKTGNMFKHVYEKLFCDSKYILHIGDDELEDVKIPENLGFNTMSILSTYDCYKDTYYYQNIWKTDDKNHLLSTRLINGLLASKFFKTINNQSLNTDKTAFNQDAYRIGYFGLGPILLGYTQWLLQKSQEDYIKHLYFLSSNGKFIKQSYDILSKHYSLAPSSSEILSSDRIIQTTIMNKDYILYEIAYQDYSNISVYNYFKNNFHFDISNYVDILEKYGLKLESVISRTENEKQVLSFFEDLIPYIKETFNNEQNYYSVYLKYQNLPNPDNSAIVDIGYNENIQFTLSEIAKQKNWWILSINFLRKYRKDKKEWDANFWILGEF